jgi:hypothetical protein
VGLNEVLMAGVAEDLLESPQRFRPRRERRESTFELVRWSPGVWRALRRPTAATGVGAGFEWSPGGRRLFRRLSVRGAVWATTGPDLPLQGFQFFVAHHATIRRIPHRGVSMRA